MIEAIKDILATPRTEEQRTKSRRSGIVFVALLIPVIAAFLAQGIGNGNPVLFAALGAATVGIFVAGLIWANQPKGWALAVSATAGVAAVAAFTANAIVAANGGTLRIAERVGSLAVIVMVLAIVAFIVKTQILDQRPVAPVTPER